MGKEEVDYLSVGDHFLEDSEHYEAWYDDMAHMEL